MAVDLRNLRRTAEDLREQAVADAKSRLHVLLRSVDLERLGRRGEFIRAFKRALEIGIARQLAAGQPDVKAVFEFDPDPQAGSGAWRDSQVHLLVLIVEPSETLSAFARMLDRSLAVSLGQLSWSRFRARQSVLEVQQVTPKEVRLGLGYGAVFHAVWTAPVKVWPQQWPSRGSSSITGRP
jgi:hypothetical protein